MQGGQPRTPVPGGALFPFGVQGPRVSLKGQRPSLRIHVRVQGRELCVCVHGCECMHCACARVCMRVSRHRACAHTCVRVHVACWRAGGGRCSRRSARA